MTSDPLADGLVSFYSSQAELILAQYENINQLLGPTSDWTHPGTHCEILLRDFFRRHLLQGMSVDKGFIYGRIEREGKEKHCPEIDILIHNTSDYRPVFRLEDFVIVQPEAVLGMIQVKRTFHSGNSGSLAVGIRQIVDAKQHLLDVIVQRRVREMTAMYKGDSSLVKLAPEYSDMKQVFTAVVSFEDETDQLPETYRNLLLEAYRANRACVHKDSVYDTSVYVLPDIIISLKHVTLSSGRRNIDFQEYYLYESICDGRNIGLQVLLSQLTNVVFAFNAKKPPFAFPENITWSGNMKVPNDSERLHPKQHP